MSPLQKKTASSVICDRLKALDAYRSANTIFAYLPLPSEPDLTPLFSNDDKTWGFARVLADDSMQFRQMTDLSQAIEGEFKIKEPDPELCPILGPESADLIIIPGVGFCPETGNRLGRGKGHYDRFLGAFYEPSNRPPLVGVCFSVQLGEVPSESHDIPMDYVITDWM